MTTISQTLDQTINAREAASHVTQDYRSMVRMNQANAVAHKARLNKLTDTFSSKNMRKQYGFFGKTKRKVAEIFHKKDTNNIAEAFKEREKLRLEKEAQRLEANKKHVEALKQRVADIKARRENINPESAKNSAKGLWNWLTKTTAGKWTAAGVAVAAIAAGTWAYFASNKEAENTNKVNTVG